MNNNRNNRRRGRNNRNPGGGGNSGNRIDSRARGNAPQMLDKYKKLAQDAQHHGDRVQAEYYLQFADHYFRVLADNKARQDEQRAKRDDDRQSNDDDADEDEGDTRRSARQPRARRDEGDGDDRQPTRGRRPRRVEGDEADEQQPARGRSGRSRKDGNGNGSEDGYEPAENPFVRSAEEPKPRRAPRKTRKDAEGPTGTEGEIDASSLPPAIGADGGDAKPASRRRRRKQDDDAEVGVAG